MPLNKIKPEYFMFLKIGILSPLGEEEKNPIWSFVFILQFMWKFMFDLTIALYKVRSSFAIDRIVDGIETEDVKSRVWFERDI